MSKGESSQGTPKGGSTLQQASSTCEPAGWVTPVLSGLVCTSQQTEPAQPVPRWHLLPWKWLLLFLPAKKFPSFWTNLALTMTFMVNTITFLTNWPLKFYVMFVVNFTNLHDIYVVDISLILTNNQYIKSDPSIMLLLMLLLMMTATTNQSK